MMPWNRTTEKAVREVMDLAKRGLRYDIDGEVVPITTKGAPMNTRKSEVSFSDVLLGDAATAIRKVAGASRPSPTWLG